MYYVYVTAQVLCLACSVEISGCGCDGSLDDGCFLCTPKDHKRPDCPETCPNYEKVTAAKVQSMSATGQVAMSGNALASVAAVLAGPSRERSDQEKAYDEVVHSVVIKDGHRQLPAPEEVVENNAHRLYMVTTIASSARYGGTRTPVVCMTFEGAKEIVEQNRGDIFETSYRLAVIEATVADWLYGGLLAEQYWYVWKGSYDEGGYVPIEKPKAYEGEINIGAIG